MVVSDVLFCSEKMLTGESRFHISTPLGIEPGSLKTGSKRVDHWTCGTVYECKRLQGLNWAPPQQQTMLVVKPEEGPAASVKQ